MKHILIIEDDQDINKMMSELLKQNKYKTSQAFDGLKGIEYLENENFDLVLLDYMLPGKAGNEVLEWLRSQNDTPVITISALNNKEIIVDMLKRGANDYLTKPFDNSELLARIEVQLRMAEKMMGSSRNSLLNYKNLVLNLESFDGYIKEEKLMFSKREFEILKLLMENPKKVFTKNNLYKSVWKEEFFGDDNTLNVHISNIRSKISKYDSDEKYIETVWGIGFKMQN